MSGVRHACCSQSSCGLLDIVQGLDLMPAAAFQTYFSPTQLEFLRVNQRSEVVDVVSMHLILYLNGNETNIGFLTSTHAAY
eukprot:767461-Hanusia_phi.AAC.5